MILFHELDVVVCTACMYGGWCVCVCVRMEMHVAASTYSHPCTLAHGMALHPFVCEYVCMCLCGVGSLCVFVEFALD